VSKEKKKVSIAQEKSLQYPVESILEGLPGDGIEEEAPCCYIYSGSSSPPANNTAISAHNM
jgi:hypothetical protein